jgi:osmotically-inducible protein OsmY
MNLYTDHNERQYADELVEAAEECLRQRAIRTVSCEYEQGVLLLRGQVPSYYHKQLIQEAVIRLKDETQVANEVEVVAPRPR